MSRIRHFGFALLAVCLLSAGMTYAQEKGPDNRGAVLERTLQELSQSREQIQEQIEKAKVAGDDERLSQLKVKFERVENGIRETKLAFKKYREQQAVAKKAAADQFLAQAKSAERFERQLAELKKADEQVRQQIKAAEKENNQERVEQLKGKAERIENNLREIRVKLE